MDSKNKIIISVIIVIVVITSLSIPLYIFLTQDSINTTDDDNGDQVNNPPTAPQVSIAPDPAYKNDNLTCNIIIPSDDVDNDTVIYYYEWFKNNVSTGLTSNAISHDLTLIGEEWKCIVTPYDGSEYGKSGNDTIIISPYFSSGNYSISPSIFYSCGFGGVNLNYSKFTFIDNGFTLTIQPAMNGAVFMTGSTAMEGTISVSALYAGSCNEFYNLDGEFTDNDNWEGIFSVSFSGSSCFDCVDIEWEIQGKRI